METNINRSLLPWRAVAILVVAAIVVLLAFLNKMTFLRAASVQAQPPAVVLKSERNSPMYISSAKLTITESSSLEAQLSLHNTGSVSIRAFTIRYEIEAISGKIMPSGASLINISTLASVIKSRSVHNEVIDCGNYSIPIKSITFYLDFVEHTDGTNWGPDLYKSAERLSGKRSGAKAASNYLLSNYREKGVLGMVNSIENGFKEVTPMAFTSSSPEWLDGFQSGKSAVLGRIRHKYNTTGMANLLTELEKPYDASEGGH